MQIKWAKQPDPVTQCACEGYEVHTWYSLTFVPKIGGWIEESNKSKTSGILCIIIKYDKRNRFMIILISNHKWIVLETNQSTWIKSFFILVQGHAARQELKKTSKNLGQSCRFLVIFGIGNATRTTSHTISCTSWLQELRTWGYSVAMVCTLTINEGKWSFWSISGCILNKLMATRASWKG